MLIKTPYLILDTEVFIRYIPNNKVYNLLYKIKENLASVKLVSSIELCNEIKRVAAYPQFTQKMSDDFKHHYLQNTDAQIETIIKFSDEYVSEPIEIKKQIPADDKKDWHVYNLCLLYDCTLISADKHLITCEKPFAFIHTNDFLELL